MPRRFLRASTKTVIIVAALLALLIHLTPWSFATSVAALIATELSWALVTAMALALSLARPMRLGRGFSALALAALALATPALVSSLRAAWREGAPLSLKTLVAPPPAWPHTSEVFADVDGQALAFDLYRTGTHDTPAPLVIVVHGGAWSGGARGDLPGWNAWLAGLGYAVIDVDYRLRPQPNWRTATADIKCALVYARAHAAALGVDAERVVMLGRSAGAHLALLAAYSDGAIAPGCDGPPASVRGVVEIYGPTDLVWGYEHPANQRVIDGPATLRRFIGAPPAEVLQDYRLASPLTWVSKTTPPTLMIHDGNDQFVRAENMDFLAAALARAGVPHHAVYLPYAQHGFDHAYGGLHAQAARAAIARFLGEVVGDAR